MCGKAIIYAVTMLAILPASGCAPKDRAIPVAYISWPFYEIKPRNWSVGEVTRCQLASRSTMKPDERGDLLLCNSETLTAWSMSFVRPDLKSPIYQNASTYFVTFRSSGHSGRGDTWWLCKKVENGISCD